MIKIAVLKIIDSYLKNAYFKPIDAQSMQKGKEILDGMNKNLAKNKDPFGELSIDDLRKVMAYCVLKRENPVLEKDDNLNYEAAANSLKSATYEKKPELIRTLIEQANRLPASKPFFVKKITVAKSGRVSIED